MINNDLVINEALLYKEPFVLCLHCKNEIKPDHIFISEMLHDIMYLGKYQPLQHLTYKCNCKRMMLRIIYNTYTLKVKDITLIFDKHELFWDYYNDQLRINNILMDFNTLDFNQIMKQDLQESKKIINKYMVLI